MRTPLLAFGVLLIFVGSVVVAYPAHVREKCPEGGNMTETNVIGTLTIQNGGRVESYVLAVSVPINTSSIMVVDNPKGKVYTFRRRGDAFYPSKPVHFTNLYVENLSWDANVSVYTASPGYSGFVSVRNGRFFVNSSSAKFGGLLFLCSGWFLVNVSGPEGVVYDALGDELFSFHNDSIMVLNETRRGSPLVLEVGCNPCIGDRVGYTVSYRTPYGGVVSKVGVLRASGVVFPRGFSFTEMRITKKRTTCCGQNSPWASPFWGVLMIVLGLLLIGAAVRRPYKQREHHLKR